MYESHHSCQLTACHSASVHRKTSHLADHGCFMTIICHICWLWRKRDKKKFYKIPGLKCHNKKSSGISNLYLNTQFILFKAQRIYVSSDIKYSFNTPLQTKEGVEEEIFLLLFSVQTQEVLLFLLPIKEEMLKTLEESRFRHSFLFFSQPWMPRTNKWQ